MKKQFNYILGLDIGSSSIGWAVVQCDIEEIKNKTSATEETKKYHPVTCQALNSRIFPQMVEDKTGIPKNQKRRAARGARRRIDRLQKRRDDLEEILESYKLLPKGFCSLSEEERNKTLSGIDKNFAVRVLNKPWDPKTWSLQDKNYISPFAIRALAFEMELLPYELGRALYHIQRRRGYLSNRGIKYRELLKEVGQDPDLYKVNINEETEAQNLSEDDKESKKELGKVLGGLALLEEKLKDKTLSQYIWQESMATGLSPSRITRYGETIEKNKKGKTISEKKNFYAERVMYKDEFEKLWNAQSRYKTFSSILKPKSALKKNVEYSIFHQNPLQSQKGKVGKCSFMPSNKRIHKATLQFQEYRIRQVINHMHVKGKPLEPELREELYQRANDVSSLNERGNISWKEVSQIINTGKESLNFKPGLEEGQNIEEYKKSFTKSGFVGNRTAKVIADILGQDRWLSFSPEEQNQLVTDLLTIENKAALYRRLSKHWKLSAGYQKDAFNLATTEFIDDTYAKHCSLVINKLLEHLRLGLIYYEACQSAGFYAEPIKSNSKLPLDINDIDDIANPIVQKALFEIRKLINSIYNKYGPPNLIRIELAREMKASKKHRKEIQKNQEFNRKNNAEADKEIIEVYKKGTVRDPIVGSSNSGYLYVSRKSRQKYIMWKKEQNHYCPYCAKSISRAALFNEAEVDHILPQTRFKDNYMNTVVCCKSCNAEKKGRTPYETWQGTPQWDNICRNMEKKSTNFQKMPKTKRNRIIKEDFDPYSVEDFTQSQLRDTSYIATACKNMLIRSGIPVQASSGGATAELRRLWGLNKLLPENPDDKLLKTDKVKGREIIKYDEEQSKAAKNRRDHRHHAIDALVIALTDQGIIQKLTKRHQKMTELQDKKQLGQLAMPSSWQEANTPGFIKDKIIQETVVSHAPTRKIRGALHEETAYSKSHFVTKLAIDLAKKKSLADIQKYLENNEDIDGEGSWIIGQNIRKILKLWLEESLPQKPKDRKLPLSPSGRELKTIALATRCYVVRKNLSDLSEKNFEDYVGGEWMPGKKKWVADKQIYFSLNQWYKKHKGNIKEALVADPPRQVSKKDKAKQIIKSIRLAKTLQKGSLFYNKKAKKTFTLGSNHHVEIFCSIQADGTIKKQGRFISMLEAAKRAKQKLPIINKIPDKDWPGKWQFWMTLSNNDIVKFPADMLKPAHLNLGLPYYRVQKMSHGVITFRHHSVSSVKDENGYIQKNINVLPDDLQKLELGPLGIIEQA